MGEPERDPDGPDAAPASARDPPDPPNSPAPERSASPETQNPHNGPGSQPASPEGAESDRECETPSPPDSHGRRSARGPVPEPHGDPPGSGNTDKEEGEPESPDDVAAAPARRAKRRPPTPDTEHEPAHQGNREEKWTKKKKVWSELPRAIHRPPDDTATPGEDGEMEPPPGEVSGSPPNTLVEPPRQHTAPHTTHHPMQMVEDPISCRTRPDEPDAPTDPGRPAHTEVNTPPQQWSHPSNPRTETKPSLQPRSLAQAMGIVKTDTPTSSTYAHGLPTIADVSPSREYPSSDEQDHPSPGNSSPSSTFQTSLSTQCYTPGSCVYLKSEAHPSTSHLLQVMPSALLWNNYDY